MSYNDSMNMLLLMKKMGFTGYSLAKESGISYTTIKEIMSGKRKIENLPGKTIRSLANAFNCSMEEIMKLDINKNYLDSSSFLRKSEYYTELLKNKKNVVLAKDSALEFYHLSNDNISDKAFVYSCGDLEDPFINKKVENFDDIDYEVVDGIMVTTLDQTINDIIADNDVDLQPLYEALNKYYHQHNNSFDGIEVNEKNRESFKKIAEDSLDYYNED